MRLLAAIFISFGLVCATATAQAESTAACHLEQSAPGTAQLVPTGLGPLGHNKFYDLVVLGPTGRFVNEGTRNPGEEVPLPFNVNPAGTYEGQIWEAHALNKGKQQPPAVVKDKELLSCTAPLT